MLWGFINAEQMMVYLQIKQGLKYPANVANFYKYLGEIFFFDILPTELLDE